MSFFLSRFVKSSSTGTVSPKSKELAGGSKVLSAAAGGGSSGKGKVSYKADIFTPLPSECIRTLKSAGIRPDEAERHFDVLCNVLLFEFKRKPLIKTSIETVLKQRKQERRQKEREERRKLKAERRAKRAEAAKQLVAQATPAAAAQPADATNASSTTSEGKEKDPVNERATASATTTTETPPSLQSSSTTTPPEAASTTTTTPETAAATTTTTTSADGESSSLLQLSTSSSPLPSPSNGKRKRRRKGKSKSKSKSKVEATTTTTTTSKAESTVESESKEPHRSKAGSTVESKSKEHHRSTEHRRKEHRSKEQAEGTRSSPSSSTTAPPPAPALSLPLPEDPAPSLPPPPSTPAAQEVKKGSRKERPQRKEITTEKEHLGIPILRSTSDPTSMARMTKAQTGMMAPLEPKSAGVSEEKTGSRKEASSRSSGSRTQGKVEANGVKSTGKADSNGATSKLGNKKKSSPENSKIIEKLEGDGLISLTDPTKILTSKSKVGHGSFGEVFTAKDSQRGCTVAVKILKKKFDVNQSAVRNEISNLKACQHENIVNFLGAYLNNNKVWVVMEYCDGGSLNQLLSEVVLSESQIAYICKEILQGLNYLHNHHRIHRDIKSDNVLLNINGRVKLADLGLCAEMKEGKSHKASVVGSRYWMAPEMIQRRPYTSKVDIWSLAALCYEMTEGGPPYSNVRSIKAMFWTATRGAPPMKHPERWSSDFHSFLKHSTDMNPETRGSAEQLLKHRFISKACERTKLAQAIEIVFLGNSLRMNGF